MKFKHITFITISFLIFLFNCGKDGNGPDLKPKPHFTKQPEVLNIQTDRATINWQTDEAANSTIKYGTSSGIYSLTETINTELKDHNVTLSQLQPNTTYYFMAESKNSGGSISSNEQQFTTLKTLSQLSEFAWENYQNSNFLEAISTFKELLSRQPNSADAFNGLGWCYASNQVDSLDRALESFDSAFQIQSNFIEALTGRGFVQLALKDYSQSITDFSSAIGINPNFVFLYNQTIDFKDIRLGLAEAYFFKQNYRSAQEQVDVLQPNNGLDPNRQDTWIVDSVSYNSYSEALLALIEKLKAIV